MFTFESLQRAPTAGCGRFHRAGISNRVFGNRELASPQVEVVAERVPLVLTVAGDGGTVEGTAAEGAMVAWLREGRLGAWPELVRWTFRR